MLAARLLAKQLLIGSKKGFAIPSSYSFHRPCFAAFSRSPLQKRSYPLPAPRRFYVQWKGYIDEHEDIGEKAPSEIPHPIVNDPWTRNFLGSYHGDLYKGYRFDDAKYNEDNRRHLYEHYVNPILFTRWTIKDEDVRRAEGIYYRGTFAEDRPEYITHLTRRRKRLYMSRFHVGWVLVFTMLVIWWWLSNHGNEYYVLDDNWAHHPFVVDRLKFFGLKAREVRTDGNGQFRAIADQLYGDEEMWQQIKDEVAPALERWTDIIFDGEHTLMDFWAPEGRGFEGYHPQGRHPLRQPTNDDDPYFAESLLDRDPQLQDPWKASENRAGWQPRFFWQRQWDRNAWQLYLDRLTREYEPGDHLTLIAIATLWKIRINILTTSSQVPHHKAWMSIDPLFEQEPIREVNLMVHTLGGHVVAYDSLVPENFEGAPAVGLDPVKMQRRSAVEKLQGHWLRVTSQDTAAQLRDQADRHAYSPVDRQWFAQHARQLDRFLRKGSSKGPEPPAP